MVDETAKLIIGCGYLGRRVAARWLAQGQRVFATTRSLVKGEELSRLGVEPIICDVLDRNSLARLPRVDTVLHCIGHDRSSGRSMRETYVNGLENIIDALPLPRRLVYVSSTSVYGQCRGESVDETAETEPMDESGRVVLKAEYLVQTLLPCAIILRFAGIYGPGRLLRRQTIERGEPIVGAADRWLNLIQVEDGVSAILGAENQGRYDGKYNVTDDRPVTRCEFYSALARLIGAPTPRFVPPGPGSSMLSHESANRRIANRLLREELGVSLQYPTYEAGLPASVGLA